MMKIERTAGAIWLCQRLHGHVRDILWVARNQLKAYPWRIPEPIAKKPQPPSDQGPET